MSNGDRKSSSFLLSDSVVSHTLIAFWERLNYLVKVKGQIIKVDVLVHQ